jgi:hypothetical protein
MDFLHSFSWHQVLIYIHFLSRFVVMIAAAYDPLDPNGNITIKWDVMSWTPDGYVVSIISFSVCVCVFFFFSYKNTLHMYIFDWSSDSSTKFSSASISLISHISQTILPKYLKKTWSRKQNKSRTIISQPCLSFETWPEFGFKFWFCLLCSPAINNRNQTRACTTFRISFPFPITLLSLITEKMKGRCLSICRHLFSSLFRRSRCKLTLS